MASWLIRLTEKLRPLWSILEELAEGSCYMAIDATGVQVLKEKGRSPQTSGALQADAHRGAMALLTKRIYLSLAV